MAGHRWALRRGHPSMATHDGRADGCSYEAPPGVCAMGFGGDVRWAPRGGMHGTRPARTEEPKGGLMGDF